MEKRINPCNTGRHTSDVGTGNAYNHSYHHRPLQARPLHQRRSYRDREPASAATPATPDRNAYTTIQDVGKDLHRSPASHAGHAPITDAGLNKDKSTVGQANDGFATAFSAEFRIQCSQ